MYDPPQDEPVRGALPNPVITVTAAGPTGGPPPEPKKLGIAVDPSRVVRSLVAAKWEIVGSIVLGLIAGGVLGVKVFKPTYVTTVGLVWEPGRNSHGEDADRREFHTLGDSVKLPTRLDHVRHRLGLSTGLANLSSHIVVQPSEASNLISIETTGTSGHDAVALANAVATVLIQDTQALDRERLEAQDRSLQATITDAQAEQARAQGVYDQFRAVNGISDLPADTQLAVQQAAQARTQADLARAEASAEAARIEALRSAAGSESRTTVVSQSVGHPAASRLAQAESDLATARISLSENHPRVQALRAQVEALRAQAANPVAPVAAEQTVALNPQWQQLHQNLASSATLRQVALSRQQTYDDLATAARHRVEQLSSAAAQASELLSSVQLATTRLNEARTQQSRIEDLIRNASPALRIVTPPLTPERPRRNYLPYCLIGGALIGLFLGLCLIAGRMLKGLRAFTAREVAYWGGGPVVGASTWPKDPAALEDLIADLYTFAARATGTTLVIAAGAEERALTGVAARELRSVDVIDGSPDSQTTDLVTTDRTTAAWEGALSGPELRRASRWADRVLVLVSAGRMSAMDLARIRTRVGRNTGFAFLLVGVDQGLADLEDRVGDVQKFWFGSSNDSDLGSSSNTPGQLRAATFVE